MRPKLPTTKWSKGFNIGKNARPKRMTPDKVDSRLLDRAFDRIDYRDVFEKANAVRVNRMSDDAYD